MAQQKPSYDASNIAEIVPNSRVSSRPTSSAQISFQVIFIGIANIDIIIAILIAITELIFVANPDSYIYIYNIYNMKSEVVLRDFPHQSWFFTTVFIITTFWLFLEYWMYQILYKGALELDTQQLKRWLNIRLIFLIFNIFQTLYRIVELQFCFYDILYIPILMYRILEIIFVKGLTVEILKANIEVIA
ncbi:uncharacterized protein LOC110847604 [Folsomia candida]|uniref:Uncharacterized protein n=1 Tax=Folsomia candida TaxID=158441 RepID=A0A226EL25_FOLCA|nr:uncharacterized protein LOC110847604 [Folsomia candida]OXA58403.1 hypothetical protein Fcan01_07778 [Folsomia candida]